LSLTSNLAKRATLATHTGCLYTFSNNDVISSVRKRYYALGLGFGLGLGLELGLGIGWD